MVQERSIAAAACAAFLGVLPMPAGHADSSDNSWSLGCPRAGLSSVAHVDGRPDATFTRVYRSATGPDGNICVIEMNGRALRMVRQVVRDGSSLSSVMQDGLASLFPAQPGQQVSRTAFLPVEGVSPPTEQQFMNSYRYVGQQFISVGGVRRRAALLVHREEGRTSSYAAESHYYFDVATHELLRFEYRPERGVPRPIFSWRVMGVEQ